VDFGREGRLGMFFRLLGWTSGLLIEQKLPYLFFERGNLTLLGRDLSFQYMYASVFLLDFE